MLNMTHKNQVKAMSLDPYSVQSKSIKVTIWIILTMLLSFVIWSAWASVAEVTTGTGVVIPSSREQTIQTLDGGVIGQISVKEGDVVNRGEVLVRMEDSVQRTELEEVETKFRRNLAKIARLEAEVRGTDLLFPEALNDYSSIKESERSLYIARIKNRDQVTNILNNSLTNLEDEIALVQRMFDRQAASETELYQLKRQLSEQEIRLQEVYKEYTVHAEEELVRLKNEVASLEQVVQNKKLALERTVIRSPVDGVVNNIHVSTLGGVVPPNGRILEIVPLNDPLVVEAQISPRDIAFIHPGQQAMVKITAYDYSIYGGLSGSVQTISPDSLQEEGGNGEYYYRVLIETDSGGLINHQESSLPISPGMIASVEIETGSKTVLQYLVQPISRAGEALRER